MAARKKIRLQIVSRHPVYLSGLVSGMRRNSGIRVTGTATRPREIDIPAESESFDILLTDLSSPIKEEARLIKKVKSGTRVRVLVLASLASAEKVYQAVAADADAYIAANSSLEQIAAAVNLVHRGGRPASDPQLEAKIWQSARNQPRKKPGLKELSERENEILLMITQGQTNEEIAQRLQVSCRTVRRYNTRIYGKLGVRNRAAAIARVLGKK